MRASLLSVACFLLACDGGPIKWGAVTYSTASRDSLPVSVATIPLRAGAGCAGAVLAARSGSTFAAWWEARGDGSAALLVARSSDGGVRWDTPVVAEARDASRGGCDRLPVSMSADSSTDYLHLTYYLEPPQGKGVYFTHSMHASALAVAGEGMFHAPVPVVFGDTPVLSSVAGRSDTVVVAFEDPNGPAGRVAVSMSADAGHIFGRYMVISPSGAEASSPRVSMTGDSVVVTWTERPRAEPCGERIALRRGRLRPGKNR